MRPRESLSTVALRNLTHRNHRHLALMGERRLLTNGDSGSLEPGESISQPVSPLMQDGGTVVILLRYQEMIRGGGILSIAAYQPSR